VYAYTRPEEGFRLHTAVVKGSTGEIMDNKTATPDRGIYAIVGGVWLAFFSIIVLVFAAPSLNTNQKTTWLISTTLFAISLMFGGFFVLLRQRVGALMAALVTLFIFGVLTLVSSPMIADPINRFFYGLFE
jgi:CHASE2 domain-containing sensor protein